MDSLKSNTKLSSMRINNRIVTYCIASLFGGVLFHIVVGTIKCTPIDWSGLGAFVIGLAGVLGAVYGSKAHQKKYEQKPK